MRKLDWKRKFHWILLYGVICIAEFLVDQAKEWVEKQIVPPKKPKDPEDDDPEEEEPEEPERRP